MLIGLCGRPGCGKDTLAHELMSHDVYERYRFADPLKNMLKQFHIGEDVWDDHDRKERDIPWLGRSPRFLAQTLGTEWGRDIVNPDIWVILAKGRWHHLNADGKGRMVIPDVRFDNEARWLVEAGAVIIEVVRDEHHIIDNETHGSEAGIGLNFVDGVVYNNGTKDELRDQFWEKVHVAIQ